MTPLQVIHHQPKLGTPLTSMIHDESDAWSYDWSDSSDSRNDSLHIGQPSDEHDLDLWQLLQELAAGLSSDDYTTSDRRDS